VRYDFAGCRNETFISVSCIYFSFFLKREHRNRYITAICREISTCNTRQSLDRVKSNNPGHIMIPLNVKHHHFTYSLRAIALSLTHPEKFILRRPYVFKSFWTILSAFYVSNPDIFLLQKRP
jgi:hypothetical protein